MKTLELLINTMLVATMIGGMADFASAETRTLTSMLVITVKAAVPQEAQAPTGLQELYNSALVQSQQNRLIKIEEPLNTPSGLPRYTMSERL